MPSRSPSCGDSGRCRWPTTPATTAWMRSRRASAPPRFALAGLSMGGYVALTIVRRAPERVQRLALLDTSARPETSEQTARRKPQIALAEAGRFAEVPPLQFPVFVHRNRQNDEALRARVRRMAEETGAQAFLRQQQAIMTRADTRPFLSAIKCPTLVLVGDGDEITPPALSQEIAAGVAGSRLVVIADCGHLSTMERPDAVNRALSDWLSDDFQLTSCEMPLQGNALG